MSKFNLPSSFFRQIGDGMYLPTEATIGPWSSDLQHGGPPSALLVNAFCNFPSPGDFTLARVTFEFFSAVPLGECQVVIESIRPGKKIELLRGQYKVDGRTFLLAQAWRIKSETGVSTFVPDGFRVPTLPGPQVQKFFGGIEYFPYAEALEWRFAEGAYDTMGPATVWTKPRIPLLQGQEISGLESLILMIDSANGVSAELDINHWTFVPVDMTIGFHRQPIGPWVGMSAKTIIGTDGIGQTTATAFDRKGGVGSSIQTLFIRSK